MRRDFDLVREIVLWLEGLDGLGRGGFVQIEPDDDEGIMLTDTKVDWDRFYYHYDQMLQSGLVNGSAYNGSVVTAKSLTPSGHDFADAVRDKSIWERARNLAVQSGATTVSGLAEAAKSVAMGVLTKALSSFLSS